MHVHTCVHTAATGGLVRYNMAAANKPKSDDIMKTRTSTRYKWNASRKLDSTTVENTSQQIGVESLRTTSLPSSPR